MLAWKLKPAFRACRSDLQFYLRFFFPLYGATCNARTRAPRVTWVAHARAWRVGTAPCVRHSEDERPTRRAPRNARERREIRVCVFYAHTHINMIQYSGLRDFRTLHSEPTARWHVDFSRFPVGSGALAAACSHFQSPSMPARALAQDSEEIPNLTRRET